MAESKRKGDLGEAMVMADVLRRGYKVAMPVGEDWRYDLIVLRKGQLQRVQCKFVVSNGEKISVPCRAGSAKNTSYVYTSEDIDCLAVYDQKTDRVYYIPAERLNGHRYFAIRLTPPKNNQKANVNWASDFLDW